MMLMMMMIMMSSSCLSFFVFHVNGRCPPTHDSKHSSSFLLRLIRTCRANDNKLCKKFLAQQQPHNTTDWIEMWWVWFYVSISGSLSLFHTLRNRSMLKYTKLRSYIRQKHSH